jgi:hypothetical protein
MKNNKRLQPTPHIANVGLSGMLISAFQVHLNVTRQVTAPNSATVHMRKRWAQFGQSREIETSGI